jgi:large subunit ribosomal protein L33
MPKASKKGKRLVYLIPESESRPEGETRDKHTYHYMGVKTASMISNQKKLRVRKYHPIRQRHEWFVEVKLPRHTK